MISSIFPDVNVLLALAVANHKQHAVATAWAAEEQPSEILLCRVVQLSFLRLLTTQAALEEHTMTNREAWEFHDKMMENGLVRYVDEPMLISSALRERSALDQIAPKRWNDAYLSAFAMAGNLRLVTFDITLASYTPGSILLRS